jgi:basic amino acid/polyamine antiporter, APA family
VNVATAAKFLALAGLVAAAITFGSGHGGAFDGAAVPLAGGAAGGVGLALVSVLWAYDGFADLSFTAGEVKNPQRNLPLAIVGGTLTLIVLYVAANVAYLYVLPLDQIRESPLVAADTMLSVFGPRSAQMVSGLVTVSAFSSLNGIMLSSPRVFFAMAEDGLFFAALARVHERFRTPHVAILLAALLGMALVVSQSFETLSSTFVLAIWPFYALSVAAVYRLRRARPDLPRPYRVLGYPIVPAIFILAVVWFVSNALVTEPISTGLTFAVILAGLPVYEWWIRGS